MPAILIVDDDPVVLQVLHGLLERPGRQIATAASAAFALEQARTRSFEVALVDKNLGRDDGLKLSRDLKAQQPDLEVLLVTGYASIESAVEAVQIGAYDYLTKPIADFGVLDLKVRSAIEKSLLRRSQRDLLQRLVESDLRHRRVIDAAPEAIVLYDAQTLAIADANAAAIRLYGYSLGELTGLTINSLRGDAGEGEPGAAPLPQRHRRKDGTVFPVEVTFTQFTQQNRLLKAQSARDMTSREREQLERQRLEEQLRSAQKLDAIGRLAGGVAHDFSNLLAVVQAHADFLLTLGGSDEARSEVDGILRAAQRGAALTRQLLLFSRRGPRDKTAIDLNALVQDVRGLLSRLLLENIQVRTKPAPGGLVVEGSVEQLTQVLLNLAVNARDAMPEGGLLEIDLQETRLTEPRLVRGELLPVGAYARLTVRDTGLGMDERVKERLFEPFFTTKPEGKGTGLGLATVYGIVAGSGGAVDVESTAGAGSAFHVWLPVAVGAHASDDPAAARPARGRGERVLLVEDEEALRVMMGRALTANGYVVVEARDGVDGLRAAGQGAIDALVTDVVMPHMDGLQLAERLRQQKPGLPVLYVSGWAEQAERADLRREPLLYKPFSTGALLVELRRLLDQGRA